MIGILVINGLQIDKMIKYVLMILLALVTGAIAIFKFEKDTYNKTLKNL